MQRSIAFYRDILGFEVRRAEPEAAPTFASLARGDSLLMLSPFGESFGDWKVADVAGYLQTSRSWVYEKAESGLLPSMRIGGLLRFNAEVVRAWANGAPAQVLQLP